MVKNKILYIISDRQFGGGSRHLFDLITNLDKKRFEPILISIPAPILNLLKNKVKTYSVEMNSRIDLNAVKKMEDIIKKEKPDIIHLHSTRAGILGTLAAKKHHIPIIYTEHLFTDDYIPHNRLIHAGQIMALRHLSKYITKVIAVSGAVKKYFVDKKVFSEDKIKVIYHGVALNSKLKTQNSKPQLKAEKLIKIGSVGTLTKLKGFEYLIKAIQVINGIKLEIIGSGEELDKLRKLDKNKKVNFLGQIKNPSKVIVNWDIYVQPSISESFGLSVAEAMAMGLPVIATNAGGIPELVGEAGILVAPKDAELLSSAIIKLSNQQSLRLRLGAQASKRIKDKFTLEKMIDKTQNLYNKTVKLH